jgi:two-component system, NtrC family, sensor histidine kinase KinB
MTLRTKLLVSLSPLVVSLAVFSVLSIHTVSDLGVQSNLILKDNYRSVLAVQRMKESIERMDSACLFIVAGRRDKGEKIISNHRSLFDRELRVQMGNITESGEREATGRLEALWTRYQKGLDRFLTLSGAERLKAEYFEFLEPVFQLVKEAADSILVMNQDAMVFKSDRVQRLSERMRTLILGAALGAFCAGLLLSMGLIRKFLQPLSVLSQAVRRMGEGDMGARAHVRGKDEIALLAVDFNVMAERLGEYQKSTLGELLRAQQASQAAIDSLPDPVLVFGSKGELLNINQSAEVFLEAFPGGKSTDPLSNMSPAIEAALSQVKKHVLSGKGSYHPKGFEEAFPVSGAEGERYFVLRGHPLYTRAREVMGAAVLIQDVTRLRRLDELKSGLVSTVAHEFRTPLTSLSMAVQICLEQEIGSLNGKQKELLNAAREDCERLQSMVNDLLDLSRIEEGRVKTERQRVWSQILVDEAIASQRGEAAMKGIELSRFNDTVGGEVWVDPDRVRLVFKNLIENALRHTPKGGSILIRILPVKGRVRFEVMDNGEGIPKEHQPFLFDRFFQVPGGSSGGAGLGLSIAKEVVVSQGGEIGVESEPGKGSTFWFTLPLTSVESKTG